MSRRIARPYAAALFKVVEKQGLAAMREIEQQLGAVAEVFRQHPAVLRAFELPAVAPGTKQQLLLVIGKTLAVHSVVQRTLAALEQHYRLRFLPEVAAAFGGLIDRKEGLTRGTVTLPGKPTGEQIEELGAALGRLLGTRVVLESKVQPDLLAGFVVRVGSQVYDGSLRTQLERFARSGGQR